MRITWYATTSTGLFGGSSTQEWPHEPLIEDLDTGIVYCSQHVLEHSPGKRPDVPMALEERLIGEAQRTIEGVVKACRVITVRGYSDPDLQTRLLVET